MFQLSRTQLAAFATVGALALGVLSIPAVAQEPLTRTGPVGPYEPILTTMGSKRLIAFYVPDSGRCSINAIVFDAGATDAPYSASRVRINLWPGEAFYLDGAKRESINLQCGDKAASLALSGPAELINTGTTTR